MLKTTFVTKLTSVETTDKEGVGNLRYQGNKLYKWVKFRNTTATVAVVAGDCVVYDNEDGANNSHVVSDYTDGGAVPIGAGVVQAAVAGVLLTDYWCWIQVKGPATLNTTIGGTPADGDQLMAGTTDKAFTKQLFAGTTPAIAATGPYVGVANDASAKFVTLDCPV